MNYQQTLDYLYQQLPVFSRIGAAAYKADLGNIIALSAAIGNPHLEFKSVHLAGTNGKGSCSHMLASVFQSAGYKTGLYTSPHIVDFRERIRINGEMIAQQAVIDFVASIKEVMDEIKPSFFELTVAMAFAHFAKHKLDIAIVEVGLGGLLDSTNILRPDLSVITNISLDHTQLLGGTLAEIAIQKAGIIKPHIPVVIGEVLPETEKIFRSTAANCSSEILFAQEHYSLVSDSEQGGIRQMVVKNAENETMLLELDLKGGYQQKNIVTVMKAIEKLRDIGWKISDEAILKGLGSVSRFTGLRGRFEILGNSPLIIADVAHNEAGIREVLQQVARMSLGQLHIVIGFVQDKDVDQVLGLFPKNAHYYFTQARMPRALPCEELAAKAQNAGLHGKAYPEIRAAMDAVMLSANSTDTVLVTGSFFILDEVFQYQQKI